jgi:FtsP/CotA-like multicopper oxidase with cupredoxin domain
MLYSFVTFRCAVMPKRSPNSLKWEFHRVDCPISPGLPDQAAAWPVRHFIGVRTMPEPTPLPRLSRYLAAASLLLATTACLAADLPEPITLASKNHLLDILMVARASPVPAISLSGLGTPTQGWIYDICPRPANGADSCPTGSTAPNYYGGTRLALTQGDTLRIRLINKLPPVADSKHASEPDEGFLALNPTNIHTHGMLVSPRYATPANPTYGDNVFVMTFNSANGQPVVSHHMHAVADMDSTEYEINIPANHPSGLFWFHPHIHGISYNQISAGMAGIITVGNVADYVCRDPGCAQLTADLGVRHLLLKDSQVLADGTLQDQPDPAFCLPASGVAPAGTLGRGACPGQDQTANGGTDYTNGQWAFTVNGNRYANIPIASAAGEVWRITNTSGSATYDLRLYNPAQQQDMIVQVLSLDGVSISPTAGTTPEDMEKVTGGKLRLVACPGTRHGAAPSPLCTTSLRMMPSSRAEIWVAYRDVNGLPTSAPNGAQAIFRTAGVNTGPGGDTWPAVDLASVRFAASKPAANLPSALSVQGEAPALTVPHALAGDLAAANAAFGVDPTCRPLAPGHKRRIFFNVPVGLPSGFGMGYEELDAKGVPVPGTFQDVKPFDPTQPTVCVQLGPQNAAVTERWELVNLASEDHNFHIHQVKFRALSAPEIAGTSVPGTIFAQGVLMDNLPLPHADAGECASVDDWRAGLCVAHPATVDIPFAIAGDFVYHCHILEHEDGGMMARIRVRPNRL